MSLTPKAIYENLRNKDLDYSSALELLITFIENTDNIDIRIECLQILKKIQSKDEKVFKLLENLLVSDSDEKIRNIAASYMKKFFLHKALEPMKWVIEHETSLRCMITAISTLSKINNLKSRFILMEKLNTLYNQKCKYNLKNSFRARKIENIPTQELAEILINYYFISFLKIRFGYLKYEFDNFGYVTTLDLTNVDPQGIFIPDFLEIISSLKHLEVLDLRFNNLMYIPEISKKLDSIISLDLSYNKIINLPTSIQNLTSLKHLNLKSNRLRSIPESLSSLKLLQTINLRNNMLNKIPKSIKSLKFLENLNLHGNKINSIEFKLPNSIKELELGWNNFLEVPTTIKSLKSLESLGMSGNKLKMIPKWICSFQLLKILDLYDNNIIALPKSMGNLYSLEVLVLRNNQLSHLPETFKFLRKIKKLNLSWNNFTQIPEWIGELNSLEELNLWGNQVETLPKSISLLSNLKVLDLSFNRLNQLPTFLSDFKKKSDLVIKL
ncbi:MAG: hypothetical protein ACFE9I_03680 [Candidatus Hermodarchaeota archaeon]